jgi:excisionase family DNA binding protein
MVTLQSHRKDKSLKVKKKKREHLIENQVKRETGDVSMTRLLTIRAASIYMGCTVWAVRSLIWSGEIRFLRLGKKRIYIDRQDLDRWIEKQKTTYA